MTLAPSGRVAMIERYVRGRRFLSVPGGRIESGESPEQAALREIEEELGLRITLAGRLPDCEGQAYFLAVVPEESELVMSGPEAQHANRNNRYTPRWVDAATLDGLPLRQPVRPLVATAAIAVSATMASMMDARPAGAAVVGKTGLPVEVILPEALPVPAQHAVIDLIEVRTEPDPAAVSFAMSHRLRRRFTFRTRDRSHDERRGRITVRS